MIDREREDMAARSPAWDDLRERRVLGRIEAELDAKHRARPRLGWTVAISATMAVAAALVLSFWIVRPSPSTELARGLAHVEPRARAAAGTLALPDGSEASLHDGALVEMRVATDDAIGLEQNGGRVRYDVEPGLERVFTVNAGDIEVRVVGTAFWVEHDGTHVRVVVEHGRVRVSRTGGSLVAELGAGEELRVETGALALAQPPAADKDTEIELVDDDEPKHTRVRKASKPSEVPAVPVESAAELQARSDDARRRGDATVAAEALRALIDRYPKDVRVYTALFQLGKVERGRGRHAVAAELFRSVVARDPNGSLAEDARAEAAASWFSAGRHDEARAAARESLAKHPSGAHASRMQRLLDRMP